MGAFKTKARAVELLGRKQIRDSVTALAEIMKNAHDADAELLRVEFLTRDEDIPSIVICDTGVGMDKDDLENKWLVLGTPSKLESRGKKTPGGRPLMGEKGIGRLALSRLGQQMWMFTKKKDTDWNILYINWNIFENPELFIEDINIPVLFGQKRNRLSKIILELAAVQLDNLKNKSWNTLKNKDKRSLIRKQIKESKPSLELVDDFCCIVEESERNQGTVIISLNLNDDWGRYLDSDMTSDEDMLAVRNYSRLSAFMSDFGKNEPDFQVEMFHDGQPLVFTAGFTEEDYELYDLKIEGSVNQGQFRGCIYTRNANTTILAQCNQVLEKGIPVTAGIKNWEADDCGKYTLKFCHFEMDNKNSGLTQAELEMIKGRMKKAGGISVYRDNVRVLPYGEPDNDFLELEERRSKSAGYYLFSHRNMFGRIDITSSENPHLEDKSSREGFLENQYYNYFIRTLQNLLVAIAVDFVGEKNKDSFKLRRSYINYNNEKRQEKLKIQEFEREQERLFQEDRDRVIKLLEDNPEHLKKYKNEFQGSIKELDKIKNVSSMRYKLLLENESRIKALRYELEREIFSVQQKLRIYINDRFEAKYEPQLLEKIDVFNEELDTAILDLKNSLYENCDDSLKNIKMKLEIYYADVKKKTGRGLEEVQMQLQQYLKKTRNMLEQMVKEAQNDVNTKYEKLLKKVNDIREYEQDILKFKRELSEDVYHGLCAISVKFDSIEYEITDPGMPEDFTEIRNKISDGEENIYNEMQRVSEKINASFGMADKKLDDILSRYQTDDAMLIGQLMTRNNELKQLNDMYADLANLGMAAEIVSHELNQLFNNIYDAIHQLRYHGVSSEGRYYLNQINIGFRAISDRMSQMSPMYRSRSMYKRNVNVYEMLEDLHRFFDSRLAKQKVKFINYVPRDLEMKLSVSKIYPVISNLIYNSLYWMADKTHKEILFRYVDEERALYVEDSGQGISIRNKERVFEPFFSLKKDGRGLGLSISKNVLEAQGYGIETVTDKDRKYLEGACFKITFGTGEGE